MLKNRPVRIIKRGQRGQEVESAPAAQAPLTEREVKTVVSGWVNEHRRRADEFRRNYADMLKGVGFSTLSSARG